MPRQSRNKSQHNRRGKRNPRTSLKAKLRARSKGENSRANYKFKKTEKQEKLQRLLRDYFNRKQDATNTVSIGKAKALYKKSLSSFSKGKYGQGVYMLLLASAIIATYVPNAVPGTTGFNGKSVDDIKGYLEYNYDVATNVGDYEWKNDGEVQQAIKEIAEDDEKVAAERDKKPAAADLRPDNEDAKDALLKKIKVRDADESPCTNCVTFGGARFNASSSDGLSDTEIDKLLASPGVRPRKRKKEVVKAARFTHQPSDWMRFYVRGEDILDPSKHGSSIWITPSRHIPTPIFGPISKRWNILRKPKILESFFTKGHDGKWKLFNNEKFDEGFPLIDEAQHIIDELDIFKPGKKKHCLTEKDFNEPPWIACKKQCFDTVRKLIKNEIHSTVFMLRYISNSLLTNNSQARVKFKFSGDIEKDITGLWVDDSDKFELLPLEPQADKQKKPRLIVCYGPSAAGKTFTAKKIIKLLSVSDPDFPTAFMAIDGGIAREMSQIYQMIVYKIHQTNNSMNDNKMSGFSNLVTAGLSFDKSLFNSEPKKQLQKFLKKEAEKGYISLYIPTTATGEMTQKGTLDKAKKISKWKGLNDTKWIGLLIYQHKTHADCNLDFPFKCVGCTESGVKRQIGEGKQYSNSAYGMAMKHGEYAIQYAPGGRIKLHNSGGFKHNNQFASSIITEYPHGKDQFILGDVGIETWKDNKMHYMKNSKNFCLLAKNVDIPYQRGVFVPQNLTQKISDTLSKCGPSGCKSRNDTRGDSVTNNLMISEERKKKKEEKKAAAVEKKAAAVEKKAAEKQAAEEKKAAKKQAAEEKKEAKKKAKKAAAAAAEEKKAAEKKAAEEKKEAEKKAKKAAAAAAEEKKAAKKKAKKAAAAAAEEKKAAKKATTSTDAAIQATRKAPKRNTKKNTSKPTSGGRKKRTRRKRK